MHHSYDRKCWCDVCRLEGKSRLARSAVWYFGTLLFLMIASLIIIAILAYLGVEPPQ